MKDERGRIYMEGHLGIGSLACSPSALQLLSCNLRGCTTGDSAVGRGGGGGGGGGGGEGVQANNMTD